jgi:hypothetical protein
VQSLVGITHMPAAIQLHIPPSKVALSLAAAAAAGDFGTITSSSAGHMHMLDPALMSLALLGALLPCRFCVGAAMN